MKTFRIELLCRNCGHWSYFDLPVKTIVRKPGSLEGTTLVKVPQEQVPGWRIEHLVCPICEIGEVY